MKDFEMIEVDNDRYSILILQKTFEPPLLYLSEWTEHLKKKHFKGFVLIDQYMHSLYNTEERFIRAYFDGEEFVKNTFTFEKNNVTLNFKE